MNEWNYKDYVLEDDDIPKDAIGFIYIITNNNDGRRYIGKKLLTKAGTEKKLLKNGTKKTVKCRKQSDWKNYWSSCDELKKDIQEYSENTFTRDIICFTFSLTTHTYLENKYLYKYEVLESNKFYNGNISSKLFKVHVMNKIDQT